MLAGNHSSETFSSAELQSFYKADGYEAYLAVGTVAFVLAYGLYRRGNSLRKGKGQSMDQVPPTPQHRAGGRCTSLLLPACRPTMHASLLGLDGVYLVETTQPDVVCFCCQYEVALQL